MSLQLAIEIYALASLICLACVVAICLKAYYPAPEVRTLERRQLNTLLESPLRADSSARNVAPVTDDEWKELDQIMEAMYGQATGHLTVNPQRPTTLARMKPASKRVM